jgi:SAM-dependent methyltransferase
MTRLFAGVAGAALWFAALALLLRQCRKPRGILGRLSIRSMNVRHAGVTNWGLEAVTIGSRFAILDVGCGGGRTVQTLATLAPEGKVFGIDYSAASAAAARRNNAGLIRAGRVEIQQAGVSRLPFGDATFDLVTAVETHYYWPNPVADLREIRRVLKPGGALIVIAETYAGQRFTRVVMVVMMLLGARYLTIDQHRALLAEAGFTDVSVEAEPTKGWIRVIGLRAPM